MTVFLLLFRDGLMYHEQKIFKNAPSLTITFPLISLTVMFPTKEQTLGYVIGIVYP